MNIFICAVEGCPDQGAERPYPYDELKAANDGLGYTTGPVFCGSCGTDITSSGFQAAGDFVMPSGTKVKNLKSDLLNLPSS